jgi:hypothetical protein
MVDEIQVDGLWYYICNTCKKPIKEDNIYFNGNMYHDGCDVK